MQSEQLHTSLADDGCANRLCRSCLPVSLVEQAKCCQSLAPLAAGTALTNE